MATIVMTDQIPDVDDLLASMSLSATELFWGAK